MGIWQLLRRWWVWPTAAFILGFIALYPALYSPEKVLGVTKLFVLVFGLLSAFCWFHSSGLPVPFINGAIVDPDLGKLSRREFNHRMVQAACWNRWAARFAAITAIALANDAYLTFFWKAVLP